MKPEKKALYTTCVKVSYTNSLEGLKESKRQEVFGPGASPKGRWRTLYKPPIEKRSGDLQWRIVHGIIATNRHRAHLDSQVGRGVPILAVEGTSGVWDSFQRCAYSRTLRAAVVLFGWDYHARTCG